MSRDGSLTPRDLVGKLDVLRVECPKCGRTGRYRVAVLAKAIGTDGKLTDWLSDVTADCPRKQGLNWSDRCAAGCPDLPAVVGIPNAGERADRTVESEWPLGITPP